MTACNIFLHDPGVKFGKLISIILGYIGYCSNPRFFVVLET